MEVTSLVIYGRPPKCRVVAVCMTVAGARSSVVVLEDHGSICQPGVFICSLYMISSTIEVPTCPACVVQSTEVHLNLWWCSMRWKRSVIEQPTVCPQPIDREQVLHTLPACLVSMTSTTAHRQDMVCNLLPSTILATKQPITSLNQGPRQVHTATSAPDCRLQTQSTVATHFALGGNHSWCGLRGERLAR